MEKIATIKGITTAEVGMQMYRNLMNLFKDNCGAIDQILNSDAVNPVEFD